MQGAKAFGFGAALYVSCGAKAGRTLPCIGSSITAAFISLFEEVKQYESEKEVKNGASASSCRKARAYTSTTVKLHTHLSAGKLFRCLKRWV